jgi:pyruvate dehydrogenase E2 component (dihydrolipoamide acetyltransferase)
MDVKLPHLGEGADSGVVVNLFVKEGDLVAEGQPILELESEKAIATIPSSAAGAVTRLHVKPGDKLSVGQKILSLSEGAPKPAAARKSTPPAAVEPAPPAEPEPPHAPAVAQPTAQAIKPAGGPVAASPTIRQLARDLGINLELVPGSARGGRIVMADLRAYIARLQQMAAAPRTAAPAAAQTKPPAESVDFSKWGTVSEKPLTPLRQVIARRMSESWNAIPHVTQFDEADLSNILALRKKYLAAYEKKGVRLTVTSFVLKAVADCLKRHPIFNSSLDEAAQKLVFKEYYHLGIAVDTEAGLIVPVLRDVDRKDLAQISRELELLAARARDRKVAADELKGGTFTISNQGGIGSAHFTPIVNRPEVAILGLGRAAAKPVARGDKIEIRTLLPLALSYDHRVIDGANAARFMVDLVKAIEQFEEAVARGGSE